MSEDVVAEKAEKKRNSRRGGLAAAKNRDPGYSPEVRLKAVRLRLEEGLRLKDVCAEMGAAQSALSRWVKVYEQLGEGPGQVRWRPRFRYAASNDSGPVTIRAGRKLGWTRHCHQTGSR
jgi:hypothetical protein